MGHRHDYARSLARALADEHGREDLGDRAERAGREICCLDRRKRRRRRLEHACPADVVEIVARSRLVRPEARDRAVDDARGRVRGADPEPARHARPERLENNVGAREERLRERRLCGQVADDRLLACVQLVVPLRGGGAHRIAARLLDSHDAGTETEQLPRREGARQVAREIDDEAPPERLHQRRSYHYPATALAERSTVAEEKRRLILDAAAGVFARKGFHTSRVGDIAEEAGVAHGLLYHYFSSKDEVLDTIFREHWTSLLDRLHQVEQSDERAVEQLRNVAAILLRGWLTEPDVVCVVIREIARSPELAARVEELVRPIGAIRRIIEHGQRTGEFRADLDAGTAAIVFYGGIDELLSAWVLGRLEADESDVSAAERHVVDIMVGGLSAGADELREARRADVPAR